MDFYVIYNKIKKDEYDEEIYTSNDDEELFKTELCLAISDSCGFNAKQAEAIYNEAYDESHSYGLRAIVTVARSNSNFIREIMNMEA